mgnify:CR=1 FL=1
MAGIRGCRKHFKLWQACLDERADYKQNAHVFEPVSKYGLFVALTITVTKHLFICL